MKTIATAIMLLFSTIAWSQDGNSVFDYLINDVKVVNYDNLVSYNYEYKNGEIKRKSIGIDEFAIIYYTELNRTDSIEIITKTKDSIFQTRIYHNYDSLGKLIEIRRGENLLQNIIYIDSFKYSSRGLIERKLVYSNRRESLFRTERIDSLILFTEIQYKYDSFDRVIERSSGNQPYDGHKTSYFYDEDNRLVKKIEDLGFAKQGCLVGADRSTSTTTINYNKFGLVEKERTIYYLLKPNGKKKKKYKFKTRWHYEYY
jgi:hypothetical protein